MSSLWERKIPLSALDEICNLPIQSVARLLKAVDKPLETWQADEEISLRHAFEIYLIDRLQRSNANCKLTEAILLVIRMGPLLYDMESMTKVREVPAILVINSRCAIWTGMPNEAYDYELCRNIPLGPGLELGVMLSIDLWHLVADLDRRLQDV